MWRADITGISKVEMHAIYSSAPSQWAKLRLGFARGPKSITGRGGLSLCFLNGCGLKYKG